MAGKYIFYKTALLSPKIKLINNLSPMEPFLGTSPQKGLSITLQPYVT